MNAKRLPLFLLIVVLTQARLTSAADRLIGVQSARVMSQSMPWIAEETGIFRKYNLEFPLVYIGTSPLATAAMLGGEAQLLIDGGVGLVRTVVGGNNDLVFIAGIKNHLTQSILAKPEIKRLEDLRGKKIGVTRIGATTHYFAIQAFKRRGMEAGQGLFDDSDRRRAGDVGGAALRRHRRRDHVGALGCPGDFPRLWLRCLWPRSAPSRKWPCRSSRGVLLLRKTRRCSAVSCAPWPRPQRFSILIKKLFSKS